MIARFPIRSIFLALAVRSVVPAIAAEQVPSCDLFRTRLVEAPKVLSLRLPSLQLHREPPDHQDDVWKTDGMRAEDSGELWYTTGVYCRAGKFREVSTDIDVPSGPLHPTFDLVAADIYAFTGWEADKVIRTADELLKHRPHAMGDVQTTEFSGAYVHIEYMGFTIGFD
jgi:hypothetical protein